jgi:hypothetical protein
MRATTGKPPAEPARPAASAPESEPAAAAAVADGPADLPTPAPTVEIKPRLAAGANGALGCGIAAPLFFLLAILAIILLTRMNIDVRQLGPQNPPPPVFLMLALAVALCVLLAVVAGLISVFWGRAVLKRIRSVPGNWIGAGRARAAWICGLITVLIPVLLLSVQVVACVMRFSR